MKVKYTGVANWPVPSDGGSLTIKGRTITVFVDQIYEFTKDEVEDMRLLDKGFEEIVSKKKKTESEEVL
jgi:hypothetical protein